MRLGTFKPSSIVLAALCLILTSSVASSQSIRADAPKMDGSVRVGLIAPRVSLLGGGGSVTQETNALQKSISSYIEGPRIGAVIIKAKLDSLAMEEAKDRQCDYVLFVSLTRKRKAVAQGSRSSYGGGSKAGDEILFEYKVVPIAGSQATTANTLRATVKADGEDVVTPMIESTAQIVVGLAKSRPVTAAATPTASPNAETSSQSKANNETVAPAPQASNAAVNNPPPPKGYGSLSAGTSRTSNRRVVGDAPKAPGTIRVGLAYPKITGSGATTGTGDATALRETISSYLAGSNIETIELKARLAGITLTEAQKRECDFVLYLSLDRKRKDSSGGGGLTAILGTIGGGAIGKKVPGSKEASKVGTDVTKMGVGISALTKANDEMTFAYKLMVSDGTRAVAEKTTTVKAKKDGDDVLTPMIESAAQAIFDATQKNP